MTDWKEIPLPTYPPNVPVDDYRDDFLIWWRQEFSHGLTFRFADEWDGEDDGRWEIEATVKWDGCVNWQTNPFCLAHMCEPDDLSKLARAFCRVWTFTRDNLDVADKDLFDKKLKVLEAG